MDKSKFVDALAVPSSGLFRVNDQVENSLLVSSLVHDRVSPHGILSLARYCSEQVAVVAGKVVEFAAGMTLRSVIVKVSVE